VGRPWKLYSIDSPGTNNNKPFPFLRYPVVSGIRVAVDLETGTVVYVGGFKASEMPRKKLPP
jgi:hypothetical protein